MKLFHSPTSPYVRKVMACAIARDIDRRIELIPTNPHESPAALIANNPLSKVPCLVNDEGVALFDSRVICEYLDQIGDALPLFPASGSARWVALRYQAMGDGILDAAVGARMESMKPREAAREAFIERQMHAIDRTLAMLEQDPPGRMLDIGSIAVACALGYLDFRFAAREWRKSCPGLAAWFAAFGKEPAIARTEPPAA
ncbi:MULTISPECIES: glutathione S-transferase [Acidiphilium]|jgi:glutathione S-transferase|uniref:glutathione S-transferase n=1 Tax=Acidiphilium TaxID=522 RepID=UPI0002145D21|nr:MULTISPECIES: glutathione S-transferase [Acidiphilium]MBU6356150.1 glutathione S-transferase [Rhodospirillales bacterium]EGO93903.1 Glutathione S-transferase domain-containing protein [Acidiphilium sp. PM]KDM67025.1 glutathione S-transferase domain-containing protein [Acidiphilium sp. JA12-A1]MBS3024575.1 glutathione S-transferase [Acidiphilium multivorum]MDE2326777.1 glutathione S-transferase [Rhodospirillales bacterium]